MKITTIGLDIAKSVFHLVALDATGKRIKRKELKRDKLLAYFAQHEICIIAMEACGGAHHWARSFQALGHTVKLIAPQYVKPYVNGNKNDYNDAAAIAEVAQRPRTRLVPIKTVEQQDVQNLHRLRERLKKQRTALVNQTRGLLAEYGLVIPQGVHVVERELPRLLEDAENELTVAARALFSDQLEELRDMKKRLSACEKKINAVNQQHETCQRLTKVQGIGPIIASALFAAIGDGKDFENGRHLAAWLGLVPRQRSSGGKAKLLGISKRGNPYLRTLLIHGARSVLKASKGKTDSFSHWAQALLARQGHNKACVAVANKLARVAWVIVAKGETYRPAQ